MASNRDVDWEKQLASIIERSDRNLHQLSSEYSKVKASKSQQHEYNANAMPVNTLQHMQAAGSQPRNINHRVDGTHERAAYNAFNAAITRPPSRSSDEEIMKRVEVRMIQTVETALNKKLVSTSKAIDALRDQICLVSSEVRDLNNQASRTSNSIIAQERRLDVICHDFDTKHGEINSIEDRIKRELKYLLHSSESNMKTNLTTSIRGTVLDELGTDQKGRLAAMKSSLMNTITDAVKTEINRLEKQCLGVIDTNGKQLATNLKQSMNEQADAQRKEVVEIITKIITVTAAELEKNMMSEVAKKLEQMMTSEVASSNIDVANLHETVELLKNDLTTKASQADSFSRDMTQLEERMNAVRDKQRKNDADIMSAFSYISEHKQLINSTNEKLFNREDVKIIVQEELDERENIFNDSTDHFVDNLRLKSEVELAKSELMDTLKTKFIDFDQKMSTIETNLTSMSTVKTDVINLEGRIDELEDDFKNKLNAMLDVVESFEQRVQDLESGDNPEMILAGFQEALVQSKSEFVATANEIRDQSKEDVLQIRTDLQRICKQLDEIDTHYMRSHSDNEGTKSNGHGSMENSLRELHATLVEAKHLGWDNDGHDTAGSILNSSPPQQKQMQQPAIMPLVPSNNVPEDVTSPRVHLMGLGSPGSITTSDSISLTSPRHFSVVNETKGNIPDTDPKRLTFTPRESASASSSSKCGKDISQNKKDLEADMSMHSNRSNETDTPTDTPRSYGSQEGSISTAEALLLCGEIESVNNLQSMENYHLFSGNTTPQGEGSSNIGSITSFDQAETLTNVNAAPIMSTTEPLRCVTDNNSTSASSSSPRNEQLELPTINSSLRDDGSSIPGSITSFDDVEFVSNQLSVAQQIARREKLIIQSVDLNAYEQWEQVLTELIQTLRHGTAK